MPKPKKPTPIRAVDTPRLERDELSPEAAPPAVAPVATKYRILVHVDPVDGRGAQIRASDDRIEVGSFASPSELAWALSDLLSAIVKLFPEHHPAAIPTPPPPTEN